MRTEKITKKDILNAIRVVAENGADFGSMVSADDVITYVDTTVAQLEAKAAKAKAKAAERKVEGDELREKIFSVLTEDYKSIADIVKELNDPDVTAGKVTARLTQLVKLNRVHKTDIKDGDRKIKGYAVGEAPEVEE